MAVPLPATAPGRAGSDAPELDGPRWVDRLNRLLHHEIRAAVADDILNLGRGRPNCAPDWYW